MAYVLVPWCVIFWDSSELMQVTCLFSRTNDSLVFIAYLDYQNFNSKDLIILLLASP